MQHISIEEGIKSGIEVWIVPSVNIRKTSDIQMKGIQVILLDKYEKSIQSKQAYSTT